MHWGPSKVIIYHQKVIVFPKKCALIPQNRSFNHIYLTFSLSKMIDTLKSKNATSRICALLWAKFARMPELGGGEGEPQPLPYQTRGSGVWEGNRAGNTTSASYCGRVCTLKRSPWSLYSHTLIPLTSFTRTFPQCKSRCSNSISSSATAKVWAT